MILISSCDYSSSDPETVSKKTADCIILTDVYIFSFNMIINKCTGVSPLETVGL